MSLRGVEGLEDLREDQTQSALQEVAQLTAAVRLVFTPPPSPVNAMKSALHTNSVCPEPCYSYNDTQSISAYTFFNMSGLEDTWRPEDVQPDDGTAPPRRTLSELFEEVPSAPSGFSIWIPALASEVGPGKPIRKHCGLAAYK